MANSRNGGTAGGECQLFSDFFGATSHPNLLKSQYVIELTGVFPAPGLAPRGGIEPPTGCLEGSCSVRLSYRGGGRVASLARGEFGR